MYEFRFIGIGEGEIQIDEFVESFESAHSFWSRRDYEKQWKSASERVDQGLPSIFFTSITEPEMSNFFRTWVCYPIGDELVFHDEILFLDNLVVPFNIDDPHKSIEPYVSVTDEGEPISEWRTKKY